MKLTECPTCHAPVRITHVLDDTDPDAVIDTLVDPNPSLHGTIRILDIATGGARSGDRRPGQYRPHYETCRGGA